MTDIARKPAGIPDGGQFAATSHGEADVSLTPSRRPQLEGWPESMPEPRLDISINDDGDITTYLYAGDLGKIEIFNTDSDHTDYTRYEGEWDGIDDDTVQEAYEWGAEKHWEMRREVLGEFRRAADLAKARIVSEATGATAQATDEELASLIENAAAIREEAEAAAERSCAALVSRKVLAAHPEATLARLEVDSYDNGVFVSGAVILDAEGNEVADYTDVTDESQSEIRSLFSGLNSDPEDSFYYEFTVAEGKAFDFMTHEESIHTLDLTKAAAWNPGSSK